ncbi:MAG TPA: hypothetical protein ENI69_02740 [Rhodospirillales bacterium]|nr:hypothetical protein [Rhodospirillales bacterium]
MPAVKKFMFDRVFEDYIPVEANVEATPEQAEHGDGAVEPDEIIPTFSQQELEEARKEGFLAGKEEGQNASLDSIERQVVATLGNMERDLTRLIDEQGRANEELSHLALSVGVSIARKMLPEMASKNALGEIERVIKNILPRIIDEPRLSVRINGRVEDEVKSRLEALATENGFEGKIAIRADQDLDISECRLQWSCGGAERNTAALWQEIEAVIGGNFEAELLTAPDENMATPEQPPEATDETTDPDGDPAPPTTVEP